MKWLIIISSGEPETICNALRLSNNALRHGIEVSVFMLGKATDYEFLSTEQFDLKFQVAAFQEQGDFYV